MDIETIYYSSEIEQHMLSFFTMTLTPRQSLQSAVRLSPPLNAIIIHSHHVVHYFYRSDVHTNPWPTKQSLAVHNCRCWL